VALIPSRTPWLRRTITLDDDVACIECDYNLRGLPISGQCPECGHNIWDAVLYGKYDAFRESIFRAQRGCIALALWPVLVLVTMAAGNRSAEVSPEAILAGVVSSVCLLLGGPVWASMPLMQFEQSSSLSRAIAWGTILGITFVNGGSAVCGPVAHALNWDVTILWNLLIVLGACQMFVLLEVPARLLLMLRHVGLYNCLYVLRLVCGILAIASFASLPGRAILPDLPVGEAICWAAVVVMIAFFSFLVAGAGAFGSHVK
jgi:hypothetical protein